MKVIWTPINDDGSSGMPVELGNDSARAGPLVEFTERDHTRAVQKTDLGWGDAPFTAGRGNHRNAVGLVVPKTHGTSAAALEWWLCHPDAFQSGKLGGKLQFVEGAFTTEWQPVWLDGRIRGVNITGKTTILEYSFTGGPITAT